MPMMMMMMIDTWQVSPYFEPLRPHKKLNKRPKTPTPPGHRHRHRHRDHIHLIMMMMMLMEMEMIMSNIITSTHRGHGGNRHRFLRSNFNQNFVEDFNQDFNQLLSRL